MIILLSLVAVFTIESTKKEIIFEKLIPPILIACIVSGTKFIMRKITKLEKHYSESDSRKSMVRKMMILQFCTVGLIVLINSFDQRLIQFLGFKVPESSSYKEFSVEWYKDAGTTITLTVAVLTLSPHLANGSLLFLRFLRQFYDQRFSCDPKFTCQYT